jgi:hypothetical protein
MLVACSSMPVAVPPPGPIAATITVVERGWHTDVCVRNEDAGTWVAGLAEGFDGARYLCFGFGERRYLMTHDHGLFELIAALFPSRAALLMTVLNAPPAAAFGPENVVELGIGRAGLAGLATYLRDAVQTDASDQPVRLGAGPYAGSIFFGATGTYELEYTCNTWTADALRAAGLPIDDAVVLAGGLMRQVRRVAALQAQSGQ